MPIPGITVTEKKYILQLFLERSQSSIIILLQALFWNYCQLFARVTEITCQYMTHRTIEGQQPDFRLNVIVFLLYTYLVFAVYPTLCRGFLEI